MAQVVVPQKKKRDALDIVMAGLGIARNIYGIRADAASIDRAAAQEERASTQFKQQQEGIITPAQRTALQQKGAVFKPPDTEGTSPLKTTTGEEFGVQFPKKPELNAYQRETLGYRKREIQAQEKQAGIEYKREQRQARAKVFNDFNDDKIVTKATEALNSARTAKSALESGNPAAIENAKVMLSRAAGNVGAMSDKDIERLGGNPSLKAKAQRMISVLATGLPPQEDIDDLIEISEIFEKSQLEALERRAGAIANANAEVLDIKPNELKRDLIIQIPSGLPNQNQISAQQNQSQMVQPQNTGGGIIPTAKAGQSKAFDPYAYSRKP